VFGVVFELNMKIFAPLLVVICFTAGIAGAYVGAYYFTQPQHPTDSTTPETPPITDINTQPENTPAQIKPTTTPTPTPEPPPEETLTMHTYEFFFKEEFSYADRNNITDTLIQLGNYYYQTGWGRPVPPGSSHCIEGLQITFHKKATPEQYALIEQSSIESYGIVYRTIEVPKYIVEEFEYMKEFARDNPNMTGWNPMRPAYGTGIPVHII
jgi:hypothetical protein